VPFTTRVPVIMDLSGLEYCDSSGITLVITAYHKAAAAPTQLVLVNLGPDLRRMFTIAGIDQIIPMHTSIDAFFDDVPQ